VLAPGPFPALHSAIVIQPTEFVEARLMDLLDWSHDLTVQFWVQLSQKPTGEAWLFSDQDPDLGGGVGISIVPNGTGGLSLVVTACTDPTENAVQFGTKAITYPSNGSWQFVRVVRTGDKVNVCLNGQRMASLDVIPTLPATFRTFNPPSLGKEAGPSAPGAILAGLLDDVRAITGALPCDPPP
jgi:hypothetical protein